MDTQKIGRFLKELRKNNNMTQEQLGDKIGVTNKTISRWETGNYLPPVENLKQLSDLYQVSINEILAGERVTSEQYTEVADTNVTDILEKIEIQNRKLVNSTLQSWKLKKFVIVSLLVVVSFIGAASLRVDMKWILIPVFIILFLVWRYGTKIYACPHCKTPVDLRLHLHVDMKCAKCGQYIIEYKAARR